MGPLNYQPFAIPVFEVAWHFWILGKLTLKNMVINHANPLLAKFGRQKARFLGMRAPEKLGKQDQGESKGPHRYGS